MSNDREEGSMEPTSVNAVIQDVLDKIERYGWTGMAIFDPEGANLPWFYTVGLTALGHPELVIHGLPHDVAHVIASGMVDQIIREDKRFEPNRYYDDVLENYKVAIVTVDDIGEQGYPLSLVKQVYGPNTPAVQVVWPDIEGRFQWAIPRDRDLPQRLFGTWQGP
jgi:hypothetical protein